jgi:glycosyltransferase involved in cell wall biosynthesis
MPKESEDINFVQMTGASNKAFDYLACGLALLVSDLPDWRGLYVAPGYGLACDPEDPETIAAALRWFLDHPEERQAMGEAGRQRILKEWNYETQFRPVWQLLNRPLQMRPSPPVQAIPDSPSTTEVVSGSL